jgi:hypothetical protein
MSQITNFAFKITPGTFIERIYGDVGFVEGATVQFTSPTVLSGTPKFIGDNVTTMEFTVEDSNSNIILGAGGTLPVSGSLNSALGHLPFAAAGLATTASNNNSFGYQGLSSIVTASNNVNIGHQGLSLLADGNYNVNISALQGGLAYSGSESSNINLNASATTVAAENHVLRIGDGTGAGIMQLEAAYISGIDNVNLATANVVTEVGNRLGTAVITGGTDINIDTTTPNEIIINSTFVAPPITITTDDSVVQTGPSFNLLAYNASNHCGGTVSFTGNGVDTMLLNVTDANNNTSIGFGSGNNTIVGVRNVILGYNSGSSLGVGSENTFLGARCGEAMIDKNQNVLIGHQCMVQNNGSSNVAIGYQAAVNLLSGEQNCILGYAAAGNYVGAESYNVILNSPGVAAETNTLRIGSGTGAVGQQLQAAYISGIDGVNVGSTATVVTEASNQLGTAVITAGTNVTVTPGANTITIAANTGAQVTNYTGVNHAASPYTALSTDYYISADVTAGVISILLPNAPTTGRIFIVKDKVGLAATSNITITTVGGAVNIDGATTFVMNTAYEAASLIWNGSSYEIW